MDEKRNQPADGAGRRTDWPQTAEIKRPRRRRNLQRGATQPDRVESMDDYSLATWFYFIGVILIIAGIAWMGAIRDEIWWWGLVATATGAVIFLCVAVGEKLWPAQSLRPPLQSDTKKAVLWIQSA